MGVPNSPKTPPTVQILHDLAFRLALNNEQFVDLLNSLNFQLRPRNQDDPVSLQALSFAPAPRDPLDSDPDQSTVVAGHSLPAHLDGNPVQ